MILKRFTDRSRCSVDAAFEEARMQGHDSVGDEDLLLGILSAGDGIAAEALSSLGVTHEDVREKSEEMFSDALLSIGISLEDVRREAGDAFEMRIPEGRRISLSPRGKNALVEARRKMKALGDGYLGTEHILLGILSVEDGTAVRILAGMGVPPEDLEEELYRLRG